MRQHCSSIRKHYLAFIRFTSSRTGSREMPMDRPSVDAMRQQRIDNKAKEAGVSMNNLYCQIIGDGSKGNPGSVMVGSGPHNYIFNCGEGFQRLAYESKIKLTKVENIFVTSLKWDNISGIFGLSLTLKDLGMAQLCVHGPDGIGGLFTPIRGFMDEQSHKPGSWNLITRKHDEGQFENPGLKVRYIAFEPSCLSSDTLRSQLHLFKRPKLNKICLAYICRAPDLPGTMDIKKCIELKVPVGPLLGKLKNGQDITLDDGRVVTPRDVLDTTKFGPRFIVLECPSMDYIDSVVNNNDILQCASLRESDTTSQVYLVVHYCPDSVINDERYKSWMKQFPADCKHIVMNSSNRSINLRGLHYMQAQLHILDPRMFPRLSCDTETSETIDVPEDGSCDIIRAKNLDKLTLRPATSFEPDDVGVDIESFLEEAFNKPEVKENLDQLHKLQEKLEPEPKDCKEPELIFFGTGSSMPSKARAPSCIYIGMSQNDSMLMDCGEGSFGQLYRYFGKSIGDVLTKLKLVFISHYHADHHLGLIGIVKQRRIYTDEPLILIAPLQILKFLEHYNRAFDDLGSQYKFYLPHVFESIDAIRTTSRKLMEHSIRTKDRYERLSPPPPAPGPGRDSMQKKELLEMLPILKDIQLIKVRHCANAYGIAINLNHPPYNYSIAYSGDAMPSNEFIIRSRGCDLLIHEGTFADNYDAEARLKRHSTFSQAIDVGKRMEAKFTILTHFSQRYAKIPLFNENFDENVGFSFDNMRLRLPRDLKRIPILKPTLNALFNEHIEQLELQKEKVKTRQEMLAKYMDEHLGTDRLDSREVNKHLRNQQNKAT